LTRPCPGVGDLQDLPVEIRQRRFPAVEVRHCLVHHGVKVNHGLGEHVPSDPPGFFQEIEFEVRREKVDHFLGPVGHELLIGIFDGLHHGEVLADDIRRSQHAQEMSVDIILTNARNLFSIDALRIQEESPGEIKGKDSPGFQPVDDVVPPIRQIFFRQDFLDLEGFELEGKHDGLILPFFGLEGIGREKAFGFGLEPGDAASIILIRLSPPIAKLGDHIIDPAAKPQKIARRDVIERVRRFGRKSAEG